MTNQEVKIIIEDYITDDRYNQAILIDGSWGCGKTFFAKGELTQHINGILANKNASMRGRKSNEFVVYISLYGMHNCDEIDSMLAIQLWASEEFIVKYGIGTIRWLWKQGATIAEHQTGITLRKNILKTPKSPKEFVVIFDDLERCNIPINEVLGYINWMVEHDKQKVIILANESEIGKQQGSSNLDSRMALILSEKIKLNEENAPSNISFKSRIKRSVQSTNKIDPLAEYTPDDLLFFAEQLSFDDVRYKQIKEKAIGLTIKYEPNLTDLYDRILATSSKNEKSKKLVNECKPEIIGLFDKKYHSNLRTFIYAIIVFEKIHEYIDMLNINSDYLEEVLKDILIYCFFIAICIKSGEHIKPIDNKYGERYMDEESPFSGKLIAYRFVDVFILHHFLDKSEVREIVEYEANYRKENDVDFLKGDYWAFTDDKSIEQKLIHLNSALSENTIKMTYYAQIIRILGEMKKHNVFTEKVDEAFAIMKKNAEHNAPPFDYEHSHYYQTFFDSDSAKMWTELTDIFNANKKDVNQSNLEMLFSGVDKWGADFSDYCRRTEREQGVVRNFFMTLPINNMINAIQKSSAADIHEFRFGLKTIYKMSNMKDYFAEDLEPLKDFRQQLDSITFENNPILCKMALELLKNEIDNVIEALSKDCI